MKKFELTSDFIINFLGKKLFRIKALIDIERYGVKVGDIGGYIEHENNLSQEGNAWVSGDARVSGKARVYGNAWVYGDARVYGNAEVYGNARVSGDARVSGNAEVYGNAWVSGNAWVYGNAEVSGNAWVYGNARVYGKARVYGNARVSGDADYTTVKGFGTMYRTTTFFKCNDGEVRVKCGCFYGTIPEFREQVKNTRSGKVAIEYLMIADLMEYHFKEGD